MICVTNVGDIGNEFQIILACIWHDHRRKCLMEAPELHKRIPARKPYVTDGLCDWEVNAPKRKCVL